MATKKPRVSIGLPLYNAERFLEQALKAILAQTFADFELIISDNASTDRTQEICLRYADADPRVKYYRNEKNIGVSRNFNRVFELSCGEYFKWCAHDDYPAPTFVERCVAVLDARPEVVMAYVNAIAVDEQDTELCCYVYRLRVESDKVHERFADLVRIQHPMVMLFGLVRSDAMRRTLLMEHYPASDRVLTARFGLMGKIHRVPEYLHYHRDYPGTSVKKYGDNYNLMAMYNPQKTSKIVFPSWAIFSGYVKAIFAYPMSLQERVECARIVARWSWRRRDKFARDISRAVKYPLRPLYYKLRPNRSQ